MKILYLLFIITILTPGRILAYCDGQTEYINGNTTMGLAENACTRQWDLTAAATDYGSGWTPYCVIAGTNCFQYDLYKDGTFYSAAYSTSYPYTFHVNYDEPGEYYIITTIIYNRGINNCNGVLVVSSDQTNTVTLTSFCIPGASYSNVNSGDGSLPLYTRTTNSIETSNAVTVSANTNVEFYSQGYILLQDVFLAESNSVFLAEIQTCNSSVTCGPKLASSGSIDDFFGFVNDNQVKVFPNPTRGTFGIYTGTFEGSFGTVEIINAMGEKIMTLEVDGIIKSMYQIEDLKIPGIYFVKISSNSNIITKKVLMEGS